MLHRVLRWILREYLKNKISVLIHISSEFSKKTCWLYTDVRYEETTNNYCTMPKGKVGEVSFTKKDAEHRCNNIQGCTMYYEYTDKLTGIRKFSTCSVGSSAEGKSGHTLYTRKGTLTTCIVISTTPRGAHNL